MRWSEEILLVEEEMRRVVKFMLWQAKWWRDWQGLHNGLPPAEEEGMKAYALRQAALRQALSDKFSSQWADIPRLLSQRERHPEVVGVTTSLD
jgi:hypothetical protein